MSKSKKNNPKFSIIVGVYNTKNFFKLTLLSVLTQSYRDFELIIVDDGSTDGTDKLIKEFALKDDRIRAFYLKKNSGKDSVPRNFGIHKAKGQYICFVDSDDLWHKEKLLKQDKSLKNDTIMVCTSCRYIDEKGKNSNSFFMHYFRKFLQKKFFKSGFVSFHMYNPVIFSSTVIKKKILKKYMFNENLDFVGIIDLELWLRLFIDKNKLDKIIFINKDLVKIRRRQDSLNREYRRASIRSMHCLTKNFILTKNYKYFYYFIVGVILRALKTILNYLYHKFKRYIVASFFLVISFHVLIFHTPLVWYLGNHLIYYDNFEKKDALVIISGNGSSNYINLEYQKRFLDIKEIVNDYDYKNIIILGRKQELREVEILTSLIRSEGIDKKHITTINDNLSTYNNVLSINKVLMKKNITGINLITSPYHTNRSKKIWEKNTKIDLNIIENKDNPLNYEFSKKIFSFEKIKVVFYEHFSYIYSKLRNQAD
jgi:glycosyltransferase involved in cell wall biosynthesis